MAYKLDDAKFLKALDYIIQDDVKKYDECLVEKFLEFIYAELSKSNIDSDEQWIQATEAIIKKLEYYITHQSFVMLNQSRAFKTVDCIVSTRDVSLALLAGMKALLDSVWKSIGMIVVNNNLSAITVIFSILEHLIKSEDGYNWIVENVIHPPLALKPSYKIENAASLARFYMETSNNYHTKKKAEKFFESLIVESNHRREMKHLLATRMIERTTKEMILEGSESVISILLNILRNDSISLMDKKEMLKLYDISSLVSKSVSSHVKQSKVSISSLCKCLALAQNIQLESSSEAMKLIHSTSEELMKNNRFGEMIVYLTYSNYKDEELSKLSLTYLLYPLINECSGSRLETLLERLLLPETALDFMNKNISDRIVTLCLVVLNNIYSESNSTGCFGVESLELIKDTLTSYIMCNVITVQKYRNVMECCSILEKIRTRIQPLPCTPFLDICEVLDKIQQQSEQMKPITLKLIGMLRHETLTTDGTNKASIEVSIIIDLAFRFDDHDVLHELALFFAHNDFFCSPIDSIFQWKPEDLDRYTELVWTHMYALAKDTEHPELLYSVAQLLHAIDERGPDRIFEKLGLKRNHDIPSLIGQYMNPPDDVEETETQEEQKTALYSVVDDILNYDLISDGINDCY